MNQTTTITNITVIDGFGGKPLVDAEVTILDGLISSVAPRRANANLVDGVTFDGRGGYLIPGLWEGHTHLRSMRGEAVHDEASRLEDILRGYLRAGITTVVDLGGPLDVACAFRNRQRHVPATAEADFLFSGPVFTGVNGWPLAVHGDHSLVHEAGDAETGRRMVFDLPDEPDVIKCMYDGEEGASDKLSRSTMKAIISAAHERGKKALVHICTSQDIEAAIDADADGIEHSFVPRDFEDVGEAKRVAKVLSRAGAIFAPTLTIFEQIARSGDPAYLDELQRDGIITHDDKSAALNSELFRGKPFPHHPRDETLKRYRYAAKTLPIMLDAGVKVAAGSDRAFFTTRPGALLRDLQLLARAGMPIGQVIEAATRRSAQKIGKEKIVGTITNGSVADAFIVNADPIANIDVVVRKEHRVACIRRGHVHDLTAPAL